MEFTKDSGIHGQWMPVTPAKPIPVKRQAPEMLGLNWAMDSVDIAGGSGIQWRAPNHGQMAALASASQGQIGGRTSGELRALAFIEGIAQVSSYRELLELNDPTIVSKMSLPHRMLGWLGDGVGSSSSTSNRQGMNDELSQNNLLLSGRFSLPPNCGNGGSQLQLPLATKPQYMSEFPFLNLNSLPENNLASTVVSQAMPPPVMFPPATPATMEKNQNQWERVRVQDHMPCEIIDLDPETSSYQDLLHNGSSQLLQSLAENPVEQCFSNQVESSQIVSSQHQEGERNVVVNSSEGRTIQQAEGMNQGIDLNMTPPQKPKRKKHRPKVVREGKPARTPKPVTPQPPKTTENPSGKRKYVRKKKDICTEERHTNPQDTLSSAGLGEVVREGKPARSPKPVTPKPPNPTENPSGKRKYVRKKKDISPQETHTNPQDTLSGAALGEVVDQDSRNMKKSVRRSLNFDLEDAQAVDRLSGSASMMPRQYVSGGHGQEAHATMENVVMQNSSDVHCSQGQGPAALGRLMGCGVGFDLNHSTNQFGSESVRIPQTPHQPPWPSRQGMIKTKWQQDFERLLNNMGASSQSGAREEGNMKKLVRQLSCQSIPGNLDRHLEDHQHQVASNTNSQVLLHGEKRGHSLVDNAQVSENISFIHANGSGRSSGSYAESSADACFLDIHKRRRIQNDHKETITNASSVSTSPPSGWRTVRNMRNTTEVFTFADAQRSVELQNIQGFKRMLDFTQVEMGTDDGRTQDHRSMSTTPKLPVQNKMDCMPPHTPAKAPGYRNGQETESFGPQARVEILIAKQTKAKPRGRRKKKDPLVNPMASNANQTENAAAAAHIGCSTIESEPQKSSMKTAQHGGSPAHHCHNWSNYQATASPRLQSGALVPYWDPVDEIVRKLGHLDINGDQEDIAIHPQNALVPYVGGVGAMVPFEGQFDLAKKRKPRAKVDLDPESHRVWKLLMGKESSEGEEGSHIDKEKWWEEERRVFHGRADSFIARMHLIQGDRRFSRWKGSVVDSVIGVFLTQNVSDHLSSSAFMSLAARFPRRPKGNTKVDTLETICRPIVTNDANRREGELSNTDFCGQSSLWVNESKRRDNKEMVNSNESLESNCVGGIIDYSKESSLEYHGLEIGPGHESPDSALGTEVTVTSCTSAVEGDGKSPEDVVSSQNSVASSQNSSECPGQTTYQSQPSQLLNFEADELLTGSRINGFSSFRELLEMADGMALHDLKATGNGRILSAEHSGMIDWSAAMQSGKSSSIENGLTFLNGSGTSIYSSNSHHHLAQYDFSSLSCAPTSSYCHQSFSTSGFVGMERANVVINDSSPSYLPSTSFELNDTNINETVGRFYGSCTGSSTNDVDRNEPLTTKISLRNLLGPINNNNDQPTHTGVGVRPLQSERHSCCQSDASLKKNVSSTCLNQVDANAVMFQQRERDAELQMERTRKVVEGQAEIHNFGTYKTCSNLHNNIERNGKVTECASEANVRNEVFTSEKVLAETLNGESKGKKVKAETEKKSFDWDSLRRQVCHNDANNDSSSDTMDSLDYEALRNADVREISNAIRERGMNNMLAERIKDFLNRLVRDHGSTNLEWLRDIPPDKAKDYLLSIRGLGLKSVECVRLLTLHHLAFPVDTNVGRICVRLGWVPLQPLPESLQLHLLEMYPMLETIQKYLWPRLCTLDQRTLYELHYQLITFGKVFCTKSKPNCNACPMRGECKHFASAFASARLALPGPEEKHLVSSEVPFSYERSSSIASIRVPLPQLEGSTFSKEQNVPRNCEPIIEEPATPEHEFIETSEIDIEDAFYNDPDEIPTIKLNFEEFTQNLQNYMQENNLGLQEGDMSKALVAISPEAASIPTPKLKNVNRLRTEHQVYELPDTHPLLEGLDKREPDDPCPYLLAIWTPGETAQSTEPSTASCTSQDTGKLCDRNTCFSCNSIREAQSQVVRGTLLIPCRTANRGSFPLNGTYFQVNEVFADHDSSRIPIDVPRDWIWNLPRRTVYFGTSIPSIFKGLTTEGIQHCFWRGFVCVRGFDRTLRAPRPLFARLHFPASKVTRNRNAAGAAARGEE